MQKKKLIKSLIALIPGGSKFYENYILYKENSCFPAGHFYSPVVLIDEARKNEAQIWQNETIPAISDIPLREKEQLDFFRKIENFYPEIPFTHNAKPELRYYLNNDYYSHSDGIVLYAIMRHFRPSRIIEIGSGFSSALMLDMNELYGDSKMELTFIEPYPERLNSLFRNNDQKKATVIQKPVQEVNPDFFKSLKDGDVLFVDSSHISKTGSDLNYILFSILPVLNKGVLIHFHDIFFPFEYPRIWVYQGRNWNEAYLLRAFLMNNAAYQIEFFTSFMQTFHSEKFATMPLFGKNSGASIWLRKTN